MTYQELIALAKERYNEGGDVMVECWDEQSFNCYIEQFGPMTRKEALKLMRYYKDEESY